MINVAKCVVCEGPIGEGKRGLVTPFLAHRIWNRNAFPVRLVECGECGFVFFNPRMDRDEEKRLYAGYRQPEYQQMRQSFEPWYTPRLNESLSDAAAWRVRNAHLEKLFRDQIKIDRTKIGSVLDFGGDRGDLIAALFPGAKLFVYDISGVEPLPGVVALKSADECRAHHFDFIVTSNVLEHVGLPRELMAQVAAIASPGTLVFNEVPCESATGTLTRAKRVAQGAIVAVTRPKVAWSLLRPGGLNLMHEHVNYFSPKSLDRLMTVMGWKVLASGLNRHGDSALAMEMVWSLAQVV